MTFSAQPHEHRSSLLIFSSSRLGDEDLFLASVLWHSLLNQVLHLPHVCDAKAS